MARPGFWRNVVGSIVNGVLSPGTTPYGPNGQYNKTLLRNGFINMAAGMVNPAAGQLSQLATSRWGGGAGQEAGQRGWSWLADQAITPGSLPQFAVDYQVNPLTPGQIQIGQPGEAVNSNRPQIRQDQPSELAKMTIAGVGRDGRSGMGAGSSVIAEGKAAQDMVGSMQTGAWLGMRSPYVFRGEA